MRLAQTSTADKHCSHEQLLDWTPVDLIVTLQVRRELQRLPGRPSQAAALAGLEAQSAGLRRCAAAMEARSVPRPQPPAYAAVQADVQRFVAGVAALPRMQSLLHRLQVGSTCRWCLDLSMHV